MEKILKDNIEAIIKEVKNEIDYCQYIDGKCEKCKYFKEEKCTFKHAHDSVSAHDIRLIIGYALDVAEKYRK